MVSFLEKIPVTVKRQEIIGDYIVDFYIDSMQVAIEVDGRQHRLADHMAADKRRDSELGMLGIKMLRYTNKDVNDNFLSVRKDILRNLGLKVEDIKK